MARRMLILTEGHTEPHTGKTAANLLRYCPNEVVALLDSTNRGKRAQELMQAGGDIPIVGSIAEAPGANMLVLGIAPPGGKIPVSWRPVILEAIKKHKMHVLSGLHDFVSDDHEFAAAAKSAGVTITDVRKNREKTIARRQGLRSDCLRLHTVGHDCSVGKMVVSVEIARELNRRGVDAKFIATGQTGIMIEGDGTPIDCVVADFVSGAIEKLVLEHQSHPILVIEGQGSLVHPSYSGVTLGLLHGAAPQALILCYEAGRTAVAGVEEVKLPSLAEFKRLNETMVQYHQPCSTIAIGMNSRFLNEQQAEEERRKIEAEVGLPVCDVLRDGPGRMTDIVLEFYNRGEWKR